jgi:hypothetical protein
VSPADLQAQYEASQSVIHELSQLDTALNRLDAVRAQVKALQLAVKGTPEEQPVKAAADALDKQITAVQDKITSNPQAAESTLRKKIAVREYMHGLQQLLEDSDQAPSNAVLTEKQQVDTDYKAAIEAFNAFVTTDTATFNAAMSARKLPGVVAGERVQP